MDASKVGGGPGGAAATSEGVLANFFNSLLSKKTGGAGGAPGAPGPGGSPGGGGMGPNGQIMTASPGGVAGGSPGGVPGSGGSGQLKAAGDNDECECINGSRLTCIQTFNLNQDSAIRNIIFYPSQNNAVDMVRIQVLLQV